MATSQWVELPNRPPHFGRRRARKAYRMPLSVVSERGDADDWLALNKTFACRPDGLYKSALLGCDIKLSRPAKWFTGRRSPLTAE